MGIFLLELAMKTEQTLVGDGGCGQKVRNTKIVGPFSLKLPPGDPADLEIWSTSSLFRLTRP